MVAANQTSTYGRLMRPELGGHHVAMIVGTQAFASSGATHATIGVPFRNGVLGVQLSWKSQSGAYMHGRRLWCSGGLHASAVGGLPRNIHVQRITGLVNAGSTFWYKVYGW